MRLLGRLFLCLFAAALAWPALADDAASAGAARVSAVSGTVRKIGDDGNWVAVAAGGRLLAGDRVVTENGARVAIEAGSSTVRLGPGTDVRFEQLAGDAVQLHFDRGELALRVRSPVALVETSVQADEGRFTPHHVGEFRFDRVGHGTLKAMAWSGDLLMEAHDSALPIAAEQRAEVWQEGLKQVTHYRMLAIPSDDFSDWVLAQDKAEGGPVAVGAQNDPAWVDDGASNAPAPIRGQWTGAYDNSYYPWSYYGAPFDAWSPFGPFGGWALYSGSGWGWGPPFYPYYGFVPVGGWWVNRPPPFPHRGFWPVRGRPMSLPPGSGYVASRDMAHRMSPMAVDNGPDLPPGAHAAPGGNGSFAPMGMAPVGPGPGGHSMNGMSPRGGHR